MKSLHLLIASIALLCCGSLSARDVNPEHWFENVPATDGSVQQCLVFRGIAGVLHTVQVSETLTDWQPYDAVGEGGQIYGLGGEIVVPLRQFTPPPPPPPGGGGDPPAWSPGINVSVMLRAATGGGTVASWRSLEHGNSVVAHLEEDLDVGWASIPLFWNRYGDYHIFVLQPGLVPIAPPETEPELSGLDEDFLEALTEHLDDMNTEVAASAAAARNAPPPAPSAPGGRKFLRIHSDYSIDSDNDGIPDYLEMEILNNPQHPDHALGSPFNADADGDGVRDDRQVDTDEDGIPNFHDASPDDKSINWEKGPVARYAFFELQGTPDPATDDGRALHVTDGGHVIFPKGVWRNGAYQNLQLSGTGVSGAKAVAMSPQGLVVGTGDANLGDAGQRLAMVYWPSPDAAPKVVRIPSANFASPSYNLYHGFMDPGTLIGEEGTLLSPEYEIVPDPPSGHRVEYVGNALWQLSEDPDDDVESFPAPQYATNHIDEAFLWGNDPSIDGRTMWHGPGGPVPLERWYARIARKPGGGFAALGVTGLASFSDAGGDQWQEAAKLGNTTDMSVQGWILVDATSIWANGFSVPFSTAAPGLPSVWNQNFVWWKDSSPKGNLLIQRADPNTGDTLEHGLAVPLVLEDLEPATGVDAVSVTSRYPGPQPANKQWIMVPAGGTNTLRIKSPANASCALQLAAAGVTLSPDTLTANDQVLSVSAPAGAATSEVDLEIKLGNQTSATVPIGIKIMKSRTVKVTVHKIARVTAKDQHGNPTEWDVPELMLPRETIRDYLNSVYQKQLNATFEVTMNPPTEGDVLVVDWDIASSADFGVPGSSLVAPGNGKFDYGGVDLQVEEDKIVTAANDPDAHINIYIVAADSMRAIGQLDEGLIVSATARGVAKREPINRVFLNGDRSLAILLGMVDHATEQKHVIAHEIGHVFFGEGHPDLAEAVKNELKEIVGYIKGGLCPLPGTDYQDRVMASGGNTRFPDPGKLVVKGEWDKAEEWLIQYVDDPGN